MDIIQIHSPNTEKIQHPARNQHQAFPNLLHGQVNPTPYKRYQVDMTPP